MQKKYNAILIILIIFLSNNGYAFEIKPLFKDDSNWLKDSLEWNDDDYSKNCDGRWYKLFNTQPVHEFITKNAILAFCISKSYQDSLKKANGCIRNNIFTNECSLKNGRLGNGNSSSNDPIISGSFFNDDPTGRLRREESGFCGKLVDYIKSITFGSDIETKDSQTYNSHNGPNQFMHAMRSGGEESTKTRNRIITYIASNYNLTKYIDEKLRSDDASTINELKILLKQPIKSNGIYSF